MPLNFNIKPTQNCSKLKYTNCSTYCSPDTFNYSLLVASIRPKLTFFSDVVQLETDILTSVPIDTVEWTVNGGSTISSTNIPTNTGTINFTQTLNGLNGSGIYTVVMTVTDTDANVSTLTFLFSAVLGTSWVQEWLLVPQLDITTGNTLVVGYADASIQSGNTIDLSTVDFDPNGSSSLSTVSNFTYGAEGDFTLTYSFDDDDGNSASLIAYVEIVASEASCEEELTLTNISSVLLTATSPSGINYATEITTEFTTLNTFDVLSEDFGSFGSFESGIWTFQTLVTKVTSTGTYLFAETIKVVIICQEECSFNSHLASYADEIDCCDKCKKEKKEKIILMQTYIDAIKNASACGDLTKITKFINLLQRLLSNKNCKC